MEAIREAQVQRSKGAELVAHTVHSKRGPGFISGRASGDSPVFYLTCPTPSLEENLRHLLSCESSLLQSIVDGEPFGSTMANLADDKLHTSHRKLRRGDPGLSQTYRQ
ncbi:hypothetical protein RRG08_000309 [Elysia crispata]|uniref:Uncharacterized protein n=1 Tax=Elysia crispata TaxID=231223 RepID=A0AAE1AD06_9GAST|nr:hypothetical protein RRG08_000309 [Elysia crispata]